MAPKRVVPVNALLFTADSVEEVLTFTCRFDDTGFPRCLRAKIVGCPKIEGYAGALVNFIDPVRSKQRVSWTHDVASDFAGEGRP